MEKKAEILAAAARLFAERGYRRTSLRQVAQAAGVSASAVSYYFGGKAGLYGALYPEAPDGADVRERIERAGLSLFAEEGYERVSIRDIAAAAEVNSAAISYYFGGKAALYRKILYRGTEMITEFVDIVSGKHPAPEEILRLYGAFLCRLGEERPEVLRVIFRELLAGTDVFHDFVRERLTLVTDILHRAVADGVAAGRLRSGLSPEGTSRVWAGMVLFFFLSRSLAADGLAKGSAKEYLAEAWRIFTAGVLAEGAERSGT